MGQGQKKQQQVVGLAPAAFEDEEDFDPGMLAGAYHQHLPDVKANNLSVGPQLRGAIATMASMGRAVKGDRESLDGLVEYLRMASDKKSGSAPEAVKTVAAVETSARRSSGAKQRELSASIDRYNTAKPALRSAMATIEAKRHIIVEKTKLLESRTMSKQLREHGKEKAAAEGQLAELEEKKRSVNKYVDDFIGFALMAANPATSWGDALSTAASYVGNTIKDHALGGTYGAQIGAVKERLVAIKSKISHLEDLQIMTEIEAAAAALDGARSEMTAAFENLTGAVYQAETAQQDLEEDLAELGPAGQAAVAALDEGEQTLAIGNEAVQKSVDLRGSLDRMRAQVELVREKASYYLRTLDRGSTSLDGNEAGWARQDAIDEIRNTAGWLTWVDAESQHLDEAQQFLAAAPWRKPLEEGVERQLGKTRSRLKH